MAWRPLLRIARRDAMRARGRSLLVVLMVMIPVAGVAFVDVMLRTADISSTERLGIELGRDADVRLLSTGSGSPVEQDPTSMSTVGVAQALGARPAPPIDPTTLLPPGSRWITDDRDEVTARTTDGLTAATFREFDYRDPIAVGTVRQMSGRAPRSPSEVVVTRRLLQTLGLRVGDPVALTSPRMVLTIVGTYRYLGDGYGPRTFLGLPGAVLPTIRAGRPLPGAQPSSYLVDTPAPVTWPQVKAFNARGVVALARDVVEHPPAMADVPYFASQNALSGGGFAFAAVAAIALVIGLAVLEVALLTGAAFAVGARRQRRALGLLAATGGTAQDVRRVVLGQGMLLGGAGGVAGIAVGVGSALLAIPVVNRYTARGLLPADLRPLELSILVALGLATGLVAAVVPARTAGRQDVLAALRARTGITRTRRRAPVAGLAATALGAAIAAAGGALALRLNTEPASGHSRLYVISVAAILGGAILTQIGLVFATPAIVGGAGRLARLLPLSSRLALRDASRHRTRTAPAVAAVLTAVAGSVAINVFAGALSDHDRRHYHPQLGYGQFALNAGDQQNEVQARLTAISRIAPPDDAISVRTLTGECSDDARTCRNVMIGLPKARMCPTERIREFDRRDPTAAELRSARDDSRCRFDERSNLASRFSGPVVGDYPTFVRLTGRRSAVAERVLAAGGMVVFRPEQVDAGRGFVNIAEMSTADMAEAPMVTQLSVPAAYVDFGPGRYLEAFASPAVAEAARVGPLADVVVLQYRTPPDDDTEERVRAELAKLGTEDTYFQVERGYRDRYGIGVLAVLVGSAVITLGAAGVATGLAQADARADHATLAAVGSPPRIRRRLAAYQSGAVASLGALLGIASGFVPMTAYLYADPEMRLVVPWRNLTAIGVVVPAVAAAGAWLLTRSELPMERRAEA